MGVRLATETSAARLVGRLSRAVGRALRRGGVASRPQEGARIPVYLALDGGPAAP